MNIEPVANPDAGGNILHGQQTFKKGIRDPEAVLRAHMEWNRGAAAEHHFANGYRQAAEQAGVEIGDALRLVDPIRFSSAYEDDKATRRRIWLEVRAGQ